MTLSDDPVRPLAKAEGEHRRARREQAQRDVIRRRRLLAGITLAVAVALIVLLINGSGGGGSASRPRALADARSSPTARPSGPGAKTSTYAGSVSSGPPARAASAGPAAGSLPQTHAFPSSETARFKSLMASLWAGVVHDSLHEALPAFFPRQAYVQLKAIAAAGSDWTDRLVHDYRLDIEAAHALLGAKAGQARLIAVNAPSSNGHWIEPGVCDNSIGYYETPNARVVYREDGQIRSFGIASMISWRGVWYVVHLGAILRSSDSGTVDEPESGPGSAAYSGTC